MSITAPRDVPSVLGQRRPPNEHPRYAIKYEKEEFTALFGETSICCSPRRKGTLALCSSINHRQPPSKSSTSRCQALDSAKPDLPSLLPLDRPSPPAKPSTVPSPRQSRLSLDTYLTPTPAKPSTRCQALDSAYLTNSTVPCQALDLPTTCQPTTCQALDSVPNTNKPRQCYLCQALDSTYLTPTTCQALDTTYLTPTTCQALDSTYLTPTTCQALEYLTPTTCQALAKPSTPSTVLTPNLPALPTTCQALDSTYLTPTTCQALDSTYLTPTTCQASTVPPASTHHSSDQLSLAVTKSNGSDAERDAIIAPAFRQTCNRQKETACTQNIFVPLMYPAARETRRRSNEQGIIFARRPRRCDLSRVASSVPQPPELSPGGQDSQVIPQPGKNPGRHSKIISQRQHPETMCRKPILATRCCFASPKPSTLGKNAPPVGSLLWPTWPSTFTVTQDALHSLKSPRGTKVQKIHSTPRLPRRPHTIIILGRSSALATLLPSSPSSPTQTVTIEYPCKTKATEPFSLKFDSGTLAGTDALTDGQTLSSTLFTRVAKNDSSSGGHDNQGESTVTAMQTFATALSFRRARATSSYRPASPEKEEGKHRRSIKKKQEPTDVRRRLTGEENDPAAPRTLGLTEGPLGAAPDEIGQDQELFAGIPNPGVFSHGGARRARGTAQGPDAGRGVGRLGAAYVSAFAIT
nr:uncharacterized protein LOC113828070 [Penaeus vannamei]